MKKTNYILFSLTWLLIIVWFILFFYSTNGNRYFGNAILDIFLLLGPTTNLLLSIFLYIKNKIFFAKLSIIISIIMHLLLFIMIYIGQTSSQACNKNIQAISGLDIFYRSCCKIIASCLLSQPNQPICKSSPIRCHTSRRLLPNLRP